MGDAERQGGVAPLVVFLDENHCRNPHLLTALAVANVRVEKLLDHFASGTPDAKWLPLVGERAWVLLTTDAKIRYNRLERDAVKDHGIRMFYFTRNDISGREMGIALEKALPVMKAICHANQPPFAASITRNGEVAVRDTFT